MSLERYIKEMPKVELHVHLEGSIRPETLLVLAQRNQVTLPADTVEGLRQWYTFTDFDHFLNIYQLISRCLQTPDDIELITREFLSGQARQHVVHSEVTYTAFTMYTNTGMTFAEQLAAINRARAWAEKEFNITMTLTIDIPRYVSPEEGLLVADMAISGMGDGVSALGLGGPEVGHPPEKFTTAFARARAAGLPSVPHAGETMGAESIWGALRSLGAVRIGHGVRCLEDPKLVEELRARQIPLEVCPTSNVCLKVAPSYEEHPLTRLLAAGLLITINSDDPPMFNTDLTAEYLHIAETFNLKVEMLEQFVLNALGVSFLPAATRQNLETRFKNEFSELRKKFAV